MKTFTLTTLAVVTLTMLAGNSAQAQVTYPGSYSGRYNGTYAPGYSGQYGPLPTNHYATPYGTTPYSSYGTGYSNGYNNVHCPNGRCGTTTGVARPYGVVPQSGLGNVFGSWLGLTPNTRSVCPNGQCHGPAHRPPTPYGTAPVYRQSPTGSNGYGVNGYGANGFTSNGYRSNGYSANEYTAGPARSLGVAVGSDPFYNN